MNLFIILLMSTPLLFAQPVCAEHYFRTAGTVAPVTLNEHDDFFNTKIISNPELTAAKLKERGFKDVSFTTKDGLKLAGLMRLAPNANHSVILSAGFLPGRMTGLATFEPLLEKNCNMLFVEGRGKGKSQGGLKFWKWWNYGVDDHLDVQAGIKHVVDADPKSPVILYGTCSGAFHSAHAILNLRQAAEQGDPEAKRLLASVCGLIFDSGWASAHETAPHALGSELAKAPWYLRMVFKPIMKIGLPILLWYYKRTNEKSTQLYTQMHKITCPVLIIHSKDDRFAPIVFIKRLLERMKRMPSVPAIFLWILPKSPHSAHHLKHKLVYAAVVRDFIQRTIQRGSRALNSIDYKECVPEKELAIAA